MEEVTVVNSRKRESWNVSGAQYAGIDNVREKEFLSKHAGVSKQCFQ